MLFIFFKFFLRFSIHLLTVNLFQYMSKEQKINVKIKKKMFVQLLQDTELSLRFTCKWSTTQM